MTMGADPNYATTTLASRASAGEERVDFVANAGYAQRKPKSFRHDGGQHCDGGNYKANRGSTPRPFSINLVCSTTGRESMAMHDSGKC